MIDQIQRYWNTRIHDLEMTDKPVGTLGVLRRSRRVPLRQAALPASAGGLRRLRGQTLLEVGCGIGTDLVRFARGGAQVTGVDLSQTAIDLAAKNFALHGLAPVELRVGQRRSAAVPGRHLRPCLWPRRHTVHSRSGAAHPRVPPRAEAGRHGHLHGLQPHLVVERAVEGDEGDARARGRPVPAQVLDRQSSATLLAPFADVRIVPGALPGEVAAARRMEGTGRSTRASSEPSTRCRDPGCGPWAGT